MLTSAIIAKAATIGKIGLVGKGTVAVAAPIAKMAVPLVPKLAPVAIKAVTPIAAKALLALGVKAVAFSSPLILLGIGLYMLKP
jgi:hypothetical protein